MPANLPPQFFELQKKLNQVKEIKEKIEILEKMLAICPKHKGTERVQEEIRKKIAKLKKTEPKKIKREQKYYIEKEGAAQVLLIGLPNVGKTTLINALCNTNFRVADYPFTTQTPQPGMTKFENVPIQIIDSPPVILDFKPGWLKNLAWQADLILEVLDKSQDLLFQLNVLSEILNEWKVDQEKTLIVINKIDLPDKINEIIKLKEKREIVLVSAKEKINLEELKTKVFLALKIIRVYPKEPGKKPDFEKPLIFKKGAKLIDLVEKINEEFLKRFKGGKLYSPNLKTFQLVGKDYVLRDEDIIEIKL